MIPARLIAEAACATGTQKPAELAEMLDFLRERDVKNMLAIGSYRGGSLWAWRHFVAGEIICIDSGVGRMEYTDEIEHTLVNADSHMEGTRDAVQAELGVRTADFLFIDGDRSYKGVRRDFDLYAPLVSPGGIIALHDVSVEQPTIHRWKHDVVPFWNQARRHFSHREIFDEQGGVWGGIGVLDVPTEPLRRLTALTAVRLLGDPTPEDRVAHVPCEEYCASCKRVLTRDEELLCTACAA